MKKSMKMLLSLQAAITLGVVSLPVQNVYADSQGIRVPFPDVKSHWSADSVAWAVGNHIVSGYEDGTFKPDKSVTEAEFLSMLIHGYKPDVKNGSANWAEPYYKLSSTLNYPVDAQDINAHNKPIRRIRVAELIASTHGMHYDGDDAIRYMYGKGHAQGEADHPTIVGFNGSKTLTRAEAVQFVKNLSEHGFGELLARPKQSSDTSMLPAILIGNADAGTETGQAQSDSVVRTNDPVANTPVLKLDDKPITFKTKPVNQDGTVYFPIEEVCSAFGIGYKENSDGSVTTTNYDETNTFRDGDTNYFIHYDPDNTILGEEEIPLDGQKPMKKIKGVFMMPAESLDHVWFAVKKEAKKFADMMIVTNGREDKSELKFYTYKQFVLFDTEDMDGTNRQSGNEGEFDGTGKIYRSIWVKEYALPSFGTSVYATWRWNSKDSLYYKFKEIKFTGKIVNGVAKGILSFEGDITYYQENDRLEQLKSEELYDIELPYENGDIKMTWNDALNLFLKNNINFRK